MILTASLGLAGVILNTYQATPAEAAAPFYLTGWAWSSNTGWISLNCDTGGAYNSQTHTNNDICNNSDYKVQVGADRNHRLIGYAWSDNVGWIRFSGLSGCPSGSCTAQIEPKGEGWQMTGWARACTVFQSGCSGALKPDNEKGGWDGWISLNCNNSSGTCASIDSHGSFAYYGVQIATDGSVQRGTSANGSFAWGSDVIGWLSFNRASIENICQANVQYSCNGDISQHLVNNIWCAQSLTEEDCTLNGGTCDANTGRCTQTTTGSTTISISPKVVRQGDPVTIKWDVPGATECYIMGGSYTQQQVFAGEKGEKTDVPTNQTTYTLFCDGNPVGSGTINVIPSVFES